MDDKVKELFDAAVAAQNNAHAPYSNFPVGAALRDEQDEPMQSHQLHDHEPEAERTEVAKYLSPTAGA